MATLICKATGNLTGATTFAVADVGAGATNLIRFNHTGSIASASTQASVAFTVTNASVIDGVLLWVRQGGTGSTGTFKVDLQKSAVSQASVTVNKTDLPDSVGVTNAPVFFKFTGTATGDGAATWTIVLTTTGVNAVSYCTTVSGATQITRALRTTTTATPAANDDLYITGELTGAATHNSFTVTMNSTAATSYGNGTVNSTTVSGGTVAISNWGTLTYGTAASTNYILRVAGDVRVNQYGTFNIGSVGAEIPRNSTAVLEFVPAAADGDFGLIIYDNAVVNMAGLSRTAGKDVFECKLTADVASSSVTTTSSTTALTLATNAALEATSTSLIGGSVNETTANSTHAVYYSGASITNTVQTATVYIRQGAGPANNRYVRVTLGNSTVFTTVTNGFWSDIDLQAGTASAITNIGTGVGTSCTITAYGTGWIIKLTGKVGTSAATPTFIINACSAVGTLSYTGVATNFNFVYDHIAVVTASSISDTTFNVDTDTGWLNGDIVCVAATSRTYTDCGIYSLNANAGSSSFTTPLYPCNISASGSPAFTHSGTSPTQAEVILLTRNVKVRTTSTTLSAFILVRALGSFTASWVEFSRLGAAATGKRGINVEGGVTTVTRSITYCSLHDFDSNGLYAEMVTGDSAGIVFSNNVTWLGAAIAVSATINGSDWTFDNNILLRPGASGFSLSDTGGTCTNNTVVGTSAGGGFILTEASAIVGTFSGNTAHSNTGFGMQINSANQTGTISNFTAWRNSGNGIMINDTNNQFIFNNIVLFGNTTSNFGVAYPLEDFTIGGTNNLIAGDSTFSTTSGFSFSATGLWDFEINNVDMSGSTSIFVPHTNDFNFSGVNSTPRIITNNCKFGAPNFLVVNGKNFWRDTGYIGSEKYNQTAGDHRCEMKYGQIRTDTVTYRTTSPSLRMSPVSATDKLESAPEMYGVKVPVSNGGSVDVAVMIKKSMFTDGTAYGGSQPRLVQRANAALGQSSDVVIATSTDTPTSSAGFSYFDSGTIAAVNLSNNSLTMTTTASQNDCGAKVADVNGKTSGKYYFEVTATALVTSGFNAGYGVATTTATYTALGTNGAGGVFGYWTGGTIYSNGTSTLMSLLGRTQGDTLGVAVDLDSRLFWARVAPSGSWNGNAGYAPGGSGGAAILAGTIVPVLTGSTGSTVGNAYTANFGRSAFIGTVPAGYTAGWPGLEFTTSWSSLAGTSSVANDDGVWEFVVDCDGLNGWLNIDDWTFSGVATTANETDNWYNGIPETGSSAIGGGSKYFAGSFV